MRNLSLASSVGFDAALLREGSFERRWAIFRDSEQCKFLILFLEKRITELQGQLESAQELPVMLKAQGAIQEARKLKGFLEQKSISNEITSMKTWLGI